MARNNIDIGALGNPATGDTLRTAMIKINNNFEELYIGNAADGQLTTSVTNGDISIKSVLTKDIEEVEYDISNQGKGLLQPKRYRNKLIFRKKVSRQDWLEEFKGKYLYFIEQQKSRFDKLIANWFD